MKRIISMILAITIMVPGFALAEKPVREESPKVDFNFLYSTFQIINKKYPFEVDNDKIIKGAVKGMLQTLDENSNYYPKEEAENFLGLTEGKIVGIGVVIELTNGRVIINEILKGNAAEKSGLQVGDVIAEVDGESIIGKTLSEVSSMLKGQEGTKVKVKINRDGKFHEYEIIRKSIEINPIKSKILEGNIGYISIDEFTFNMSKKLEATLKEMDKKNVKKIIIDLRNNPGGLLSEAVNMANLFIPAGDVVHIRYKDYTETLKSNLKNPKYEIAVLVNEHSASASEIFAGAVKDRKAGTIIGTRTYGKSTVQSLLDITDGSIVKLTIAEYLTPNKLSIHKKGIEPNILVENNNPNIDLQLQKAIEVLK